MTPGQVDVLARVHNRANGGDAPATAASRPAPDRGTNMDLIMLARTAAQ